MCFASTEDPAEDVRKNFKALEREEAKGRAPTEAWKARTRELEVKDHELRLLQDQQCRAGASFLISPFFGYPLDEAPTALS